VGFPVGVPLGGIGTNGTARGKSPVSNEAVRVAESGGKSHCHNGFGPSPGGQIEFACFAEPANWGIFKNR
jgi:hypothetical protein